MNILSFLVVYVLQSANGQKPGALERALEARSSSMLPTARIEYSIRDTGGDGKPSTRFYSQRCAGDDVLVEFQGDEAGIFTRGASGERAAALDRPYRYLIQQDHLWRHIESTLDADVFELSNDRRTEFEIFDVRCLGLNPVAPTLNLEESVRRAGYPPLEYTEESEGVFKVVTAASGRSRVRWWIDPQRGWNITKTEAWAGQQLVNEWQFELAFDQTSGLWFPKRLEHFQRGEGDPNPDTTIEISFAEFNRPEHPQSFTPADIGVEVGTKVIFQDSQPLRGGCWDGDGVVQFATLMERIQRGELQMGPTRAREASRARARRASETGADPITDRINSLKSLRNTIREDPWALYTRKFIAHYHLQGESVDAAWGFYELARRQAVEWLDAHLASLQKESDTGRSATDSTARAKTDARLELLLKPLNEIFERSLRAKLDKIPTRQERERAGPFDVPLGGAASKPSKP